MLPIAIAGGAAAAAFFLSGCGSTPSHEPRPPEVTIPPTNPGTSRPMPAASAPRPRETRPLEIVLEAEVKSECPTGIKLDVSAPPRLVIFRSARPNVPDMDLLRPLFGVAKSPAADQKWAIETHPILESSASDLARLESVAIFLGHSRFSNSIFEVAGHTATDGGDEPNRLLSHRRAELVANLLAYYGVRASQLRFRGYGEACLTQIERGSPTQVQAAQEANRRIEIWQQPK